MDRGDLSQPPVIRTIVGGPAAAGPTGPTGVAAAPEAFEHAKVPQPGPSYRWAVWDSNPGPWD
jgi:hypothetical protein